MKCNAVVLVVFGFQVICGIFARPDNYRMSEEKITNLKNYSMQWKERINWDKKPCDEFYDFICTNRELPQPKRKIADDLLKEIWRATPEIMTEPEEKYLKFSTMCTEIKTDEQNEYIKTFKFNNIGNWPAFDENWDETKFNLPLAILEMELYSFPVVFTQHFDIDKSLKPFIKITKEHCLDVNLKTAELTKKFEDIGVKNIPEVIKDAALFAKKCNEASEAVKHTTDLKMKVSEMKNIFTVVDWQEKAELIYGEKIPEDYVIVIEKNEEIKAIYKAVSKLSPKTIANYFFCVFVNKIRELSEAQPNSAFLPVFKKALVKYLINDETKMIFKSIYLTLMEKMEEIADIFKTTKITEYSSKLIDDELLGVTNENDLIKKYEAISTNSKDCLKNYQILRAIFKKNWVKNILGLDTALKLWVQSDVTDLIINMVQHNEQPVSFIFESIASSMVQSATQPGTDFPKLTTEQKNCFGKQIEHEITDRDVKVWWSTQFIMKAFTDWIKEYPDVVQEENKILKEYNLCAETLLALTLAKYGCRGNDPFSTFTAAFSNSLEFQKLYECPIESKMNSDEKCKLW